MKNKALIIFGVFVICAGIYFGDFLAMAFGVSFGYYLGWSEKK